MQTLTAAASSDPTNPVPPAQLGNAYFDAERYPDAVKWYEVALRLKPDDPNVSTDLGVAYYYTNQPDKAIQQFEQSLRADPKHTKTMLNMGIVKAFGKQDLAGASEAWKQVIATAPNSPEAQAAKKALDGLQQAHPGGPPSGSPGTEPCLRVFLRAFLLFVVALLALRAFGRLLSGLKQGVGGPGVEPAPGRQAHPPVKMARIPCAGPSSCRASR